MFRTLSVYHPDMAHIDSIDLSWVLNVNTVPGYYSHVPRAIRAFFLQHVFSHTYSISKYILVYQLPAVARILHLRAVVKQVLKRAEYHRSKKAANITLALLPYIHLDVLPIIYNYIALSSCYVLR